MNRMRVLWVLLCAIPSTARLAPTEDSAAVPAAQRFGAAYEALVAADEARDQDRLSDALSLYRKALDRYLKLSQQYPEWQPGVTRFRTDYCDNQIRAVLKRMGGGEPGRGLSAERVAAGVADGSPDESARGASTLGQMKGDARHLLLAGETSSARRLLLKALQTDADDPDVRTLLAVLHCQAGQYDNAVYMMEQLVSERDAGAVAHLVLGGAYLALGRVSDSERHVRRAIEIDPASGEAHYDMAQVLVARDPPDAAGARRHYGLALKLGGTADASLEGRMGTPTAPANGPEREGPAPRLPTAREGAASRE